MREIPRFEQKETDQIAELFSMARISYALRPVNTVVSRFGGKTESIFRVEGCQFESAIDVVKSYYGFVDGPAGLFSGLCPSCNVSVESVDVCPACELSLVCDPMEMMADHPFCVFLKQLESGLVDL